MSVNANFLMSSLTSAATQNILSTPAGAQHLVSQSISTHESTLSPMLWPQIFYSQLSGFLPSNKTKGKDKILNVVSL